MRIFFRIRDFAERHKRLAVGDRIAFTVEEDAQGSNRAKQAVHVNDGGRLTVANLFVLAGLLVLPILALRHWQVDWRWAGGIGLSMELARLRRLCRRQAERP